MTELIVTVPAAKGGHIKGHFNPSSLSVPETITLKQGDAFLLRPADYHAADWLDPQAILKDVIVEDGTVRGRVNCEPGPGLLFLSGGTEACPVWLPLRLRVEPQKPQAGRIWKAPDVPDKELSRWVLVNLDQTFNSPVTEVLDRILGKAVPPPYPASNVGSNYRQLHLAGRQKPKVSVQNASCSRSPCNYPWEAQPFEASCET